MIRRNPAARPLFSLGYQLRDLPDFVAELISAGVQAVIDVRQTAWSHKPGFSKARLQQALKIAGISYVHAPFAGNPKQLRQSATAHEECLELYDRHLQANPEVLARLTELVRSLGEGVAVCFICYERHPEDCHRRILLERWAEHLGTQLDVEHLATESAPRFIRG